MESAGGCCTRDRLVSVMRGFNADYFEFRYHSRKGTRIKVVTGALEEANYMSLSGVAVRALVDGSWGFSSTGALDAPLRRIEGKGAGGRASPAVPEVRGRVGNECVGEFLSLFSPKRKRRPQPI